MIPVAEIRVTEGYYEITTCKELDKDLDDERLKDRLKEYCHVRGRDINVLLLVIIRDEDGNVKKVWSIETYYGPSGVLVYLDNPWV